MKRLLDWDGFNKYSEFADANLVLENQGEDINSKKTRIKVSYAFQIITGRYRFFAELAYKLKIVYTRHPDINTAAVDGVHLFINPDFFAPLTEKHIDFILCHEVLHCALLHFARMEGRDPRKWNYATDYAPASRSGAGPSRSSSMTRAASWPAMAGCWRRSTSAWKKFRA